MKTMKRSKKVFLVVGMLVVGILLFFCHNVEAAELTKVQVQMNWDPNFDHAGYMLARDLGFYTQEGLEVEFLPGRGSTLVASIVGANRAPLGFIDASVLLSAREKGMPLKAVAGSYQSNSTGICFLQKSGIKEPGDLKKPKDPQKPEKRSILSDFKSFRHNHLLAFLPRIGLSPEEVRILDFTGGTGARVQMLLGEKVDAITFVTFATQHRDGLLINLEGVGYFLFRDYGVESINLVIVANEEFMKKNPQVVSGFVNASARAWEYTMKHPEEAARALIKYAPDLNETAQRLSLVASMPFIKSARTQNQPWGYMSLKDWEDTQKIFVETGLLTGKTPVKDAFTNEFLR